MKIYFILIVFFLLSFHSKAQKKMSEKMANSFMQMFPDSIAVKEGKPARWDYEQGLMLKSLELVWLKTGDPKYFQYIQKNIDSFVNEKGEIRTYPKEDFNLDNILTGRILISLYRITGKDKYRIAAFTLKDQLTNQPKTSEGGYFHKLKYQNQMWLDGIYMAEPFAAEFAETFNKTEDFDETCNQLFWMYKHVYDPKTGLLYHGWDEKRKEKWANPISGTSSQFWGRAIGWYLMATVDILDYLPQNHPNRKQILQLLQNTINAVVKFQDQDTGCWYQVMNEAKKEKNYLESSSSSMFVYGIAKAVRKGYVSEKLLPFAQKGYKGILKNFVEIKSDGSVEMNGTVSVGGLGGSPYRDGTYEYYMSEPIKKNDLKGIGPFIMASTEVEMIEDLKNGKDKQVLFDNYYNNEYRKDFEGKPEKYHYTLNDRRDSGYYGWGKIFENYGAKVYALTTKPSTLNLKNTNIYLIVDPDTPKETESPNYFEEPEINVLKSWVQEGGKLVILQNDNGNSEFENTNKLVRNFGFDFFETTNNKVVNRVWDMGKFDNLPNHPIFDGIRKIYMKEIPSINMIEKKGKVILEKEGKVYIAEFKFGKGSVIAICDPWFYNEYLDGRLLPLEFENFKAANNLTKWLLK